MDDLVKAAMAKWPNVPDCRGWLGLCARGQWWLRDARTQAAGAFPHPRGSRVDHQQLRAFIERNYAATPDGAWYFQNGPQRVFVELEAAPWVWHVDGEGALTSHTGTPAQALATWLDEAGRLFVTSAIGAGLVHSQSMAAAADALDARTWPTPTLLRSTEVAQRLGFVASPAQRHGASRV